MPNMTPLVYGLSIFWGYRLFKQCKRHGGWFHGVFAPVFGLILLQGPWIVGSGNMAGHGLLFLITFAWIADMFANKSSERPTFQSMAFDEKLLLILTIISCSGWVIFQMIKAGMNMSTVTTGS